METQSFLMRIGTKFERLIRLNGPGVSSEAETMNYSQFKTIVQAKAAFGFTVLAGDLFVNLPLAASEGNWETFVKMLQARLSNENPFEPSLRL